MERLYSHEAKAMQVGMCCKHHLDHVCMHFQIANPPKLPYYFERQQCLAENAWRSVRLIAKSVRLSVLVHTSMWDMGSMQVLSQWLRWVVKWLLM